MSRRFTVTAERGREHGRQGWWATECAEVGAVSQVRRLDQAADDIREAIAYLAGLPWTDVVIDVVPSLPEEFHEHYAKAKAEREKEARAKKQAAAETRIAARILNDEGLTLRDIGTAMGISHQRAAQLLAKPRQDLGG